MKKLFFFALALCCLVSFGMAQTNDVRPYDPPAQSIGPNASTGEGLGDLLWTMDVEGITGDNRCLGVTFDGTNYWITGAYDFSAAYLYEISPGGALINTYYQPAGNWGYWGWRDLAYDGAYLYAGDDSNMPGYITQIDPATGSVTGTYYGPFPVVPCRALGYDPVSDSFWTGSWSSSLYQCFRDGTYNTYANPTLGGIYGAAGEDLNNFIWYWSQDGTNLCLASEMNPVTGTFTGKSFDGQNIGMSGGACAYDAGGGAWELVGLHQGSPDVIAAYDLDTAIIPLRCDVSEISSELGGCATFTLNAGAEHGGEYYGLFGTYSGTAPGILLPTGLTLPINWDWLSHQLVAINFDFGYLDADGTATATLCVPPGTDCIEENTELCFAFTVEDFSFVSNNACFTLTIWTCPDEFSYDDGSTENLLGYYSGGDMCWLHGFDAGPGCTIDTISAAWGSAYYTGYGPGNGVNTYVYVWDDPTDDMDPLDCVLMDMTSVVTANYDLDILNDYALSSGPINVVGIFFIGAVLNHVPGQYVAPMDSSGYVAGTAWIFGEPGGTWDPYVLSNNSDYFEMGSIGYPYCFLLRAK